MGQNFETEFERLRRSMIRGRLYAVALATFAGAGAAWWLFGAADARFAPGPVPRTLITVGLVAGAVTGVVLARRRYLRMSDGEVAARIDATLGDSRAQTSGALKLAVDSGSPLARWLAERERTAATRALTEVAGGRLFPKRALRYAGGAFGAVGAVWLVSYLAAPEAVRTVGERLMRPAADLPPWSPLSFTVEPGNPSVLYGGSLDVTVVVRGGDVEHLECLVRDVATGKSVRLPAFRENDARFTRRLDNVTGATEIAFTDGHARSAWVPVEVLMYPVVLSGKIEVTPPAYLGAKPLSFALDSNEIRIPAGSRVDLTVTGNRPLAGGDAVYSVKSTPGRTVTPQQFRGESSGGRDAVFSWVAHDSGELVVTPEDLRGTKAPTPLKLAVRTLADAPPEVVLESPHEVMYATERTVVPLVGSAKDDHGLATVRLVRAVAGFRERTAVVAEKIVARDYAYKADFDLGAAGAKAGQVLELSLEATDLNPSLMGRGASDIARIVVISDEEYGDWLRQQATVEQFAPRFNELNERVAEAREALEKLEEAANSGDAEALEKARAEAQKKLENAAKALDRLASDFPAFEMEKRLAELAGENAEILRETSKALAEAAANGPEALAARAREGAKKLGALAEENEELAADAHLANEAAKIMEMAGRFARLRADQESLMKRLQEAAVRIQRGDAEGARMLQPLGETQAALRRELDELAAELLRRRRAMANLEELEPMRAQVGEFLLRLAELDPGSVMQSAADAAKNGESRAAAERSERALALLDELFETPGNGFCENCQGGGAPKFDLRLPDLNKTMEQMLEALCQNPGSNPGSKPGSKPGSSGFGTGGSSRSGYAMAGIPSTQPIPVSGPARTSYRPASMAGEARGKGAGAAPRRVDAVTENSRLKDEGDHDALSRPPLIESVPESYRESVKRYFEQQ